MDKKHLNNLIKHYPELKPIEDEITGTIKLLITSYENSGKLLVAGNGGSASDADHIVGELMKSFILKRPLNKELVSELENINSKDAHNLLNNLEEPLTAINLNQHNALSSAFINDIDSKYVYAQQILGYGKKNDVFIGISTSGKAENIYYAMMLAKTMGLKTILLTGDHDSKTIKWVDITLKAPSKETYRIQEYHLPIYHCIALTLEDYFFNK